MGYVWLDHGASGSLHGLAAQAESVKYGSLTGGRSSANSTRGKHLLQVSAEMALFASEGGHGF